MCLLWPTSTAYWLAVHDKNPDFWQPIVRHILLKPNHPNFEQCLHEFVSDGLNGFSTKWPDGLSLWKAICNKTEDLSVLLERLIFETGDINYVLHVAKEMWADLYASYVFAKKISRNVQACS